MAAQSADASCYRSGALKGAWRKVGLNIMALNASQDAIIAERRERVAHLRLRGFSQREIVVALGDQWSLGTINSDIKALEAAWRKEAKRAIDHHKARELAELQEAKRQAWHDNDLPSLLRAVSLEMDLLGTEAPKRQDSLNFDLDVSDLPDDVIDKLARGDKVDLAAIASQSRARKKA
jgi:hypothetical protein